MIQHMTSKAEYILQFPSYPHFPRFVAASLNLQLRAGVPTIYNYINYGVHSLEQFIENNKRKL